MFEEQNSLLEFTIPSSDSEEEEDEDSSKFKNTTKATFIDGEEKA